MTFRNKIAGAFGAVDLKFAIHPLDMSRAIDLLRACVDEDISLKDLLSAVDDHLRKAGAQNTHIEQELSSVEAKFSGWLS